MVTKLNKAVMIAVTDLVTADEGREKIAVAASTVAPAPRKAQGLNVIAVAVEETLSVGTESSWYRHCRN